MKKLLTLIILLQCATGLFGQNAEDATITKITNDIGGTWRLVPEKDKKPKKNTEFKIEINTVEPTDARNVYKMKGSIVGFAIEDGYAYYKGDVLVFGYTRTNIVGIQPNKEEKEYITGSIKDGQLTFVSYSPKSSARVLSGSVWERPK